MMNAKSLLILLLISTLAGCSWFGPKPIEIKTKEVERVKLNIGEIEPVKLKQVKWIIITPENASEVFKVMKDNKQDEVLFGLSDFDYENLAMNMAAIRAYMVKQGVVLKAYKEYYEEDKPKEKSKDKK